MKCFKAVSCTRFNGKKVYSVTAIYYALKNDIMYISINKKYDLYLIDEFI
jgi:hypothetical protein